MVSVRELSGMLNAPSHSPKATIAAKPRLGVLATKQQVRIASENLVSTAASDMDRTLIAAAGGDTESRATMRAYLKL